MVEVVDEDDIEEDTPSISDTVFEAIKKRFRNICSEIQDDTRAASGEPESVLTSKQLKSYPNKVFSSYIKVKQLSPPEAEKCGCSNFPTSKKSLSKSTLRIKVSVDKTGTSTFS